MMHSKIAFQRGVALIQVLLITAILMLLAIQLNKAAKLNVNLASGFNEKTKALMDHRTATSELLYYLLTNKKESLAINVEGLNFYGETFNVTENVKVTIKDTASLLNLHFPNEQLFRAWGNSLGLSPKEILSIKATLKDWQDKDQEVTNFGAEKDAYSTLGYVPGNTYMSNKQQLSFLYALDADLANSLMDISTVFGYSSFNPYLMPEELLRIYFSEGIYNEIISSRRNKELNTSLFTRITGISEGEGISFARSNYLEIRIETSIGEARFSTTQVVELMPEFPVNQNAVSNLYYRVE